MNSIIENLLHKESIKILNKMMSEGSEEKVNFKNPIKFWGKNENSLYTERNREVESLLHRDTMDDYEIKESAGIKDKIFIGNSSQLWDNADNNIHIGEEGKKINVENIDWVYALNIKKWYFKVKKSKEEFERLDQSKLFRTLDNIIWNHFYKK